METQVYYEQHLGSCAAGSSVWGNVQTICTEFQHGGEARYALTSIISIREHGYERSETVQEITHVHMLLESDTLRHNAQRLAIAAHEDSMLCMVETVNAFHQQRAAARATVHANGKPHRALSVVVVD